MRKYRALRLMGDGVDRGGGMTLTAEQIEGFSHEARHAVWNEEFNAEVERIRVLIPSLEAFCRQHDIRFEVGPMYGASLVSTRPVTPGGVPGWLKVVWDRSALTLSETDEDA